MRRTRATACVSFIGLFAGSALLTRRGNDGEGQLASLAPFLVAGAAVSALCPGVALRVARSLRSSLVLGAVLSVLPLVAVLMGRVPPRAAAASGVGLALFGSLVLGALAARRFGIHGPGSIASPLLVVLVVNAVVAVAQAFPTASPVLGAIKTWDLDSRFSAGYFIAGRASGLFLNPNDLGTFAAVSGGIALTFLGGGRRWKLMAAASLVLVALSGSRGSLLGLLAASCVCLVIGGRGSGVRLRTLLTTGASLACTILLAGTVLLPRLRPQGGLLNDGSITGRGHQLSDALSRLTDYPLGFFGPVQLLTGNSLDNDLSRVLLQGGPILLAAVCVCWFSVSQLRSPHGARLLPLVAAVVVTSTSQLVIGSVAGHLFFFFVGWFASGPPIRAGFPAVRAGRIAHVKYLDVV